MHNISLFANRAFSKYYNSIISERFLCRCSGTTMIILWMAVGGGAEICKYSIFFTTSKQRENLHTLIFIINTFMYSKCIDDSEYSVFLNVNRKYYSHI